MVVSHVVYQVAGRYRYSAPSAFVKKLGHVSRTAVQSSTRCFHHRRHSRTIWPTGIRGSFFLGRYI